MQDVQWFKDVFGGSILFDSSQNGYYHWSVQSRADILNMLAYFNTHTSRSHKSQRIYMIKVYYALFDLKAYKPDHIHHKAWLTFMNKWNNVKI